MLAVVAAFILKVEEVTRFWLVGLRENIFPKETVLFHFGDSMVEVGETRTLDDPKCGLG